MSMQSNSEGLQRILQAVNGLPEGTQLPALSNAGTASDLASGKQLIDQNGNIITGTHQCQAGVTVQRKAGTFTTNSNSQATVDCGWQPDVVYIQGFQVTDGATYSYSATWLAAEENRSNPVTMMWCDGGFYEMFWEKYGAGFTVRITLLDFSFEDSLVTNKTFNYVAIKYT